MNEPERSPAEVGTAGTAAAVPAGTDADGGETRYAPEWLALREPADAEARAAELLGPLRAHLAAVPPPGGVPVVRDLGCGTGSMGRWLAGRLPGPQRWILHDRDPGLLARAAGAVTGPSADGGPVTAVTEQGDIGLIDAARLDGTSLVTASALLDLLTAGEIEALAEACSGARCPALLTISVAGRVEFDPADPLDAEIEEAFNAHQRRVTGGRRLLGPDAVAAATAAFERHGAVVTTAPSPWRLGSAHAELTAEWLRGWVGAAVEQRPELAGRAHDHLRRRLEACRSGALGVVVHHEDLLALPAPATGGRP
ncbi:class I SAM-dependent methyltransferase [Sphaerisporangium fuscum]|uniref:class I SAM-dependent methyltransferase n=1 Tax=Sphaerisporangium fuscum TaxID=2835868 RepID=UPI0027E2BAAB|nr:class I SAM-dependent methyltransferase [Sphaerisporangium fuscum]